LRQEPKDGATRVCRVVLACTISCSTFGYFLVDPRYPRPLSSYTRALQLHEDVSGDCVCLFLCHAG